MAEIVEAVEVGAETASLCPACQALLSDGTIQGKSVLYCTKCRGLLVAMDKLLPLVEFLRALSRPSGSDIQPRDNSERIASSRACCATGP